jgi:hypothetical protein
MMNYSILLYSFVVLFFFVEISLMIKEKKQSKGKADDDRGSRVIILLATGIGLTAAIVFSYTTISPQKARKYLQNVIFPNNGASIRSIRSN